jgi:archaellum biogenesis protein FlaJ (TadC family)
MKKDIMLVSMRKHSESLVTGFIGFLLYATGALFLWLLWNGPFKGFFEWLAVTPSYWMWIPCMGIVSGVFGADMAVKLLGLFVLMILVLFTPVSLPKAGGPKK